MNNKIRELAKQARIQYEQGGAKAEAPGIYYHEDVVSMFAEHIISECIGVAEREDTDVMMKEGYPCSQTAKKIRDHFGVK